MGELLCAIAHKEHGLEATIARCFAFVGPHLPLDAHFAIGNFIRDAMNGEPIKVKDGFPFRSYLYASDLTIWLWTILFKGEACHPYNVGSDQEITIAELAAEVAQHFRVPLINSNRTEIVMPANYVPDISRSMRQLGLNILIARNDSVNKTAAWATSLTA